MKAVLTICAVALIAWAMAPDTAVAGAEIEVYMDDPAAPGTWPTMWPISDPDALAKLFRLGSPIDSACNKKYWYIDFEIHASVAQWVHWTLTWQGWQWYVKKPGCYAGDCVEFWVASNGDIFLDYFGFDHLTADPPNMHDETIATYYAFGPSILDAEAYGWVAAPDMATQGVFFDETTLNGDPELFEDNLHYGIAYKMWSKVCVDVCNTACEYHDYGTIIVTLDQQKWWIDDFGDWVL